MRRGSHARVPPDIVATSADVVGELRVLEQAGFPIVIHAASFLFRCLVRYHSISFVKTDAAGGFLGVRDARFDRFFEKTPQQLKKHDVPFKKDWVLLITSNMSFDYFRIDQP